MTMHLTRSLRLAAAVLLVPTLLAGCAGSGGGVRDTSYVARDVNTLYLAAQNRLERGQYNIAAALFDEVERQHPYSPWARRAQLMSAYSYWLSKDHTKSIDAANRFLSIHPGNRDAPYATYLIALNYYEQISDVKRDQKTTRDALNALGEVMRRYPTTQYAADAKLKTDLVNDHLAGKEMEVGRYYERAGNWLAASLRFREVIDKYQTTSHTPEALFRLTESYLSLGIPGEAKEAAAVLGANYPGSKWYERAYKLIQKHAPGA